MLAAVMRSIPYVAVFAALITTSACSSARPVNVSAAEVDIRAVLDAWHAAAARADEEAYFRHFAPDAVFLGTDATERWTLPEFRAYAHPIFARGKAWNFRAARRAISVAPSGELAWFDEDLVTEGLGPARGSGVLVHPTGDGPWRIAQYNLAITIPNDRFDEVKALLASQRPVRAP
jgi:ketosteroid isomerase-like protein